MEPEPGPPRERGTATYGQWLDRAAAQLLAAGLDDSPALDAELMLAHAAAWSRARLVAERREALPAAVAARAETLLKRRRDGEPVAYLTGHKEFWGLDLGVASGVLVPRPDTETLVEAALDGAPVASQRVLDACTGSGAVALALKKERPAWHLVATDLHATPLAVARANGERLGLAVDWYRADLWPPPAAGPFALIVANPPYLAADDPHLTALACEPLSALVAADDGLAVLSRLAEGARARLTPGGWLWLEHGFTQAAAVRAQLAVAGFTAITTRRDLAGHERVTGGCRPGD